MPCDFTVILPVRQRFGDGAGGEFIEFEVPFVGVAKSFPFACPNVDPRQMAVLQFESLGVSAGSREGLAGNILRINSVDIPGGIRRGPFLQVKKQAPRMPIWKTHSLLVPANVLRQQNDLFIESITASSDADAHRDNFILDNIVVFFKTRRSGGTVNPSRRVAAGRSKPGQKAGSKEKPYARRGLKK